MERRNQLKEYSPPCVTKIVTAVEGGILAGSDVQTRQVEFKAHTESYETESFDWGNISFE